MSEKQKNAIETVEKVLGIQYKGDKTAQGAFLFLRDNIDKAKIKVNELIKDELFLKRNGHIRSCENEILDEMVFYRFDNSEHQLGDEDDTFAETPTVDSLSKDLSRWINFI